MRLLTKLVTYGGVAAFFFFSWVIMQLWNSIISSHLGLLPALNYWQAAGLWFMTILFFAWAGLASTRGARSWNHRNDWDDIGSKIESKIKRKISHWADKEHKEEDWSEVGERIERKVKQGLSHWAEADPDTDWDDLGEHIEEKIKKKVKEWAKEEE